ncbi:hypothetical protein [Yokenella regensburgei]|uniref:hypothetical protein n=1 Tax=Yokenella regensburgei TaxID=158877 RepID=UPI0013758860|nr:hypothetical protein [Yokenella regensburgei]KAF1366508.1 hypothetical protein FHR25_005027 [Yokenella regensburgei]
MRWEMTLGKIAILMKSMSGRPYGWGNYNLNNDYSAEICSLMTLYSRSIIGGAVFSPLIASYPDNPSLESLAGNTLFKLGFIE